MSLNGMTPLSTTHSQAICRPLLAHDKQAVFDMAHAYGIPYFKDSTPAWSTRGQLRNELLPLLGIDDIGGVVCGVWCVVRGVGVG